MKKDISQIHNPTSIDDNFVESEIKKGKTVIIQFSDPTYDKLMLTHINELCKRFDHNLQIRFYGHHFSTFNCSVVKQISDVKNLSVDSMTECKNVNELKKLENLKVLELGIYELKEPDFFKADNFKNLIELEINITNSKKLNLEHISNFKQLKYLTIEEHTKNIEAIGDISNLEYLCLRSIKKKPVDFINHLKKLTTLRFLLGSRENINEINENGIENLDISWVRGFNDISNLSNFKRIKTFSIEDTIKLTNFNIDTQLTELTDLEILNCKSLNSLSGIDKLTNLNKLIVGKTDIDFETFNKQIFPKTLKVFDFYTGKQSIDTSIKTILQKSGFKDRFNK